MWRPGLAPGAHRLDRARGTLEHGLDRPVRPVAYPARDTPADRLAPAGVPEEHTLDPAPHDHPTSDHHTVSVGAPYDGLVETVVEHVKTDGGIVVGHDGSEHAAAALRCAADLAKRFGRPLHVVRTWAMSNAPRPDSWSPGFVPPLCDYETAVMKALVEDVKAVGLTPGDDVTLYAVHGAPARRLAEASKGADLLVLARRGRGGFAGLGLGSVTEQCIRNAGCPVVVVPVRGAKDELDDADRGVAETQH
jgi:nucleotide-binding universal stress UspA family protein